MDFTQLAKISDKELIALKRWNPPDYVKKIIELFEKTDNIELRLLDRAK